jgi:3-hydroxyisobutyrate dehydrogenase-like beta-hydroxyacid dehydrogenase
MCGGDKEAFDRAKPYIEMMGGRIVHAGKVGNGL